MQISSIGNQFQNSNVTSCQSTGKQNNTPAYKSNPSFCADSLPLSRMVGKFVAHVNIDSCDSIVKSMLFRARAMKIKAAQTKNPIKRSYYSGLAKSTETKAYIKYRKNTPHPIRISVGSPTV